jgi:AcrB/AcrD/AcrF family
LIEGSTCHVPQRRRADPRAKRKNEGIGQCFLLQWKVGLVVRMGLTCKNAILIVEFARELEFQGKGVVEAALEACRLRLRPIVMTSVAFIAGDCLQAVANAGVLRAHPTLDGLQEVQTQESQGRRRRTPSPGNPRS